jgi:HAD superfamily hydrolase (TIGR01509 family)
MANSGLFMDLDGTLADSLWVLRSTYAAFLRHFGAGGSAEEFASLNGPPLRQVVASLKRTHGLSWSDAELFAFYCELLAREYDRVDPQVGAEDLLHTARGRGMRTAIVTSGSEALTTQWLRRVRLDTLVDRIVGCESSERGKPHPEPYLVAIRALDCEARKSVAVEDSHQGALAAVSAGLRTLIVRADATDPRWPPVEAYCRDLAGVREYLVSMHE